MSPPDANTKRERGVLAQREYRKRHASKVQKLQDENRRLKDVIGDIDRALAARGALPEELRAALAKARDVAGIAEVSNHDRDEARDQDGPSSPQQEAPPAGPPEPSATPEAQVAAALASSATTLTAASGRVSPRLDYGLWLDPDRLVRVIEPPVDIVPYLGAGADTLAGRIFWATMRHTTDLWDARAAAPAAAAAATRHLDRMFGHSRHLSDRAFLMSLAQARVDYRSKGYMFRKLSEQFERNAMADLCRRIRDDYERSGRPSRWWKRPEEVAECVTGLLTPAQKTRFQAVVEGKGERGDAELMRPLVAWLAQNFICFGDGPRWSSVFVSVGIGSWINEVRAREGLAE